MDDVRDLAISSVELDAIFLALGQLASGNLLGYMVVLDLGGRGWTLYQCPVGRFKLNYMLTEHRLVLQSILV